MMDQGQSLLGSYPGFLREQPSGTNWEDTGDALVLRASRKEKQNEIRHVKFRRMGAGLEGRMGLGGQVPHCRGGGCP